MCATVCRRSSSLKGLMIAVISFIDGSWRTHSRNPKCTIHATPGSGPPEVGSEPFSRAKSTASQFRLLRVHQLGAGARDRAHAKGGRGAGLLVAAARPV